MDIKDNMEPVVIYQPTARQRIIDKRSKGYLERIAFSNKGAI